MTDTPAERGAESIWITLRRRKVVQWGLGYIAGAWALLQGIAFFADVFGWPHQSKRIGSLLLLVGLPIVLVLAWYHGDRGQQRISRSELGWLVVLAVLGGGVLWFFGNRGPTVTATSPTATLSPPASTTAISTDARPSIAVLPFENRSREADDVFFVDGVHDDILTQLTKVGALKVIARTSVEQFRDTKLTTRQIGEKLGVTKVLEGGVQRAGDRVRVTVQLIDAASDAHVWAENYDRELTAANIFAIQSEVATAIAGALHTALSPAEKTRVNAIPTENLDAWEAYQLGRQRLAKRTSSSLTDAEKFFRQAIGLDPRFALAYAGLSNAIFLQIDYAGRPRDAAMQEAQGAADRALALDSNSAEAWAAAGLVALDRNQNRAEALLRRANNLNPNYAQALQWLSYSVSGPGRWDEAVEIAERAAALDPLSAITISWLGHAHGNAGHFDRALVALKRTVTIDPDLPEGYAGIGRVYRYGLGRPDAAVPWYEKAHAFDPGNPEYAAELARAHWDLGNRLETERWLRQALSTGEDAASVHALTAVLYRDSGDDKAARQHAQRAVDLDPGFLFVLREYDLLAHDYATARGRYEKAYPQLFRDGLTKLTFDERNIAIELAYVLQHTGDAERTRVLLDLSEAALASTPRLGWIGYRIADAQIAALRGDKVVALTRLREAEQARWRSDWRYYRDFDPALESIRNEPEFKAIFADIERDMARQRAALAARPKDAPLDLAATGT